MSLQFRSIRWKLITSSLLAIGIPLLLFAYSMASFLWTFYRDNLERELRSKAYLVAEACAPTLSPSTPDDPRTLATMVEQWRVHSDVRVTVANAASMVVAASSPEDLGAPIDDSRKPGLLSALRGQANSTIWKNPQYGNQDTMYVNVPVRLDDRIVGAVRVAYTLTQIQQKIERIRSTMVASVGIYAILIVVLTFWLAGSIAAPIEALTREAQRLAGGDLSQQVRVKGTEEINQLANTLNQMTQRLQHLEGLRRQYVSNVSHELRTPLASIRGMAETLLIHGDSDPELRSRYLPRIVSQTDRLARLATQLLDLAQIESGSILKFLAPVSLKDVLGDVEATCGEKAQAEGVRLAVEVSDDLPKIAADRDRLVQVFLNLVDNAIRHTPTGGTVIVRAFRRGERFLVTVRDNGSGIPAKHVPHLFERFYRVDMARSAKAGGTGLGLSIVQQIVQAHGGAIAVTSDEGIGTCFEVELPLVPPEVG